MAELPDHPGITDPEAAVLAREYAEKDPFEDIPEALLSAEHIRKYAEKTGMLHPFYPGALKAASYEVHLAGEVISWKPDKDEPEVRHIKRGIDTVLKLPPNSITFAQVEPQFRLPHYMAVRFNLRIAHVHRGLLLGTGPLVDPGFEGKLLIPLHNLTATVYRLDLSEALIWLEFTKTSYGKAGGANPLYHFPERAKNKPPSYYLSKASGGAPIASSIPRAVQHASDQAREAEKAASRSAKTLTAMRNIGIVAVLTGVAGVAAALFQSLNIDNTLSSQMFVVHQLIEATVKELGSTTSRVGSAETQVGDVAKLRADLAVAQHEIQTLEAEVGELRHAGAVPPQPAAPHP